MVFGEHLRLKPTSEGEVITRVRIWHQTSGVLTEEIVFQILLSGNSKMLTYSLFSYKMSRIPTIKIPDLQTHFKATETFQYTTFSSRHTLALKRSLAKKKHRVF